MPLPFSPCRGLVALAIGLTPLFISCQSPPGCAYRGACGDVSESHVCLSFCEPTATESMVAAGPVRCALDPCAPGAFDDDDVFACPADHRCVPDESGDGVCARLPGLGARCGALLEPADAFESCADGLACLSTDACSGAATTRDRIGLPSLGPDGIHADAAYCLPPAREGDVCDSNLVDAEPGCLPCEVGFRCLDAAPFGLATEPGQRRCLRPCERDGEIDPGLCRCGDHVSCKEHPDPGEFEGRHFCYPCAGNNEQECSGPNKVLECCNAESGAECQPVSLRAGAEPSVQQCCLGEGNDHCGVDQGPNAGCCPGSLCTEDGCALCGRSGEAPTDAGCCEGFVPRSGPDGEKRCEPCRTLAGTDYCSGWFLETIGRDGAHADFFGMPSRDVSIGAVRPISGGELLETAGSVGKVRYRLAPQHRAYLFRESLYDAEKEAPGALGRGTEYLALPPTDDAEASFEVEDTKWSAARIYDLGECSAFIGYERLNNLIAVGVLQDRSLSEEMTGVRSLSFQRAWTEPFFGQVPHEPVDLPQGAQWASDYLKISVKLRANMKSCWRDTEIEYVALVRIAMEPARTPRGATLASDALMTEPSTAVGCEETSAGWRCRMVERIDGESRPVSTRAVRFSNESDFGPAELEGLRSVGCTIDGERYRCLEPHVSGDRLVSAVLREVEYRRPLSIDYTDQRARVVLLHDDLSLPRTCYWTAVVAPLVRNLVRESLLESEGPSITERLETALEDATDTLGVQPRRFELLPEGLAIVLAEKNDPQVAPVRRALEDSPILSGLFGCEPFRVPVPDSRPQQGEVIRARTVGPSNTDPGLPSINTRLICGENERDCNAICSEFGMPCDEARTAYFAVTGSPGAAGGDSCFRGECCRESETCDGYCSMNFDLNPEHCGTCGNECPEEQACIGGACTDCPDGESHCLWDFGNGRVQSLCYDLSSDFYSCGGCFVVCDEGERCEEGSCVAL